MKHPSTVGLGPSLTAVASAALLFVHLGASALSLGRLTVQSTLGEALRAEIDITSITAEEASAFRASLASPEAFRAAGVDFNAALVGAQAVLARRADGRQVIRLSGDRAVGEPFIDVVLDFSWNGGRLQRAYTLLIDPPPRTAPTPAPAPTPVTAPALTSAPPPPPPPAAAPPAPRPAPTPPAPAVASRPAASPPPVAAPPAPSSSAAGTGYRVRRGDTLSAIAAANGPAGVSLDQMLVSLYRGNPQAFVGNNMNRLKSGVVLNLPQAEDAKAISNTEARQVIQAHSADFAAFRRQLAGAAPMVSAAETPRQTRGKVDAAVEDRKTTAAPPAPDKLTLSRGAVASAASASTGVEAKLSKETERKAAEARVAELARNVDELKKLSSAAAPASAASVASKSAPVAAPAASAASAGLAVPVAAPVVPPVAAASEAASRAASAAAPASAAVPASAPEPAASAASKPAPASAPPTAGEEAPGSFLDSITSSPYVLPGAVGLVALLAGLGLMRVRRRSQESGSETSFLESKLQPDSFFGVTGGQRVDTRDGGNSSASSSLSYSLSQLDAIGDVDPVAEADVYLAYGRDLQAEEILKEALRTDPGRAAIRTKLLEVYAKRADAAAFESQALQLREVVGEDGDDWLRAQAMGRDLDPGNPLYGPPQSAEVDIDTSSEPPPDLRADPATTGADQDATRWPAPLPDIEKTLPLDEPAATVEGGALDLDIDLESPSPLGALEDTRPQDPDQALASSGAAAAEPQEFSLDDDDEADAEPPRRDPPPSAPVDFDFGDLSLDLDTPAADADAVKPAAVTEAGEGDAEASDDDPLARKLELADEFRRIGDTEGARDLLDEVISQAEGALKAKAQAMLDGLG